MKIRNASLTLGLIVVLASAADPSFAQTATLKSTPVAASAPTAVPALVPYVGTATASDGKPLIGEAGVTFLIYKDETGGEPLFAETQTVALDPAGRYKVQLGATVPDGLPADLFATGEARWLEVQIAGQPSQPRVLLASVPYALKAADATTLGGLPVSAFVLAGAKSAPTNAIAGAPEVTPTGTTVTTTGGISGYIPEFSGASTIVDSPILVSSTKVAVGTTAAPEGLEINGTMTVNGGSSYNGQLLLPATGTATSSTGYNSQLIKLYTSAWNSVGKAAVAPRYQWQAEVTGNDTPSPGATRNLLSSVTGNPPTETGFYFNPNGILHFAPGQTFPGTGTGNGTITGVAAGTDLTGGGTTGSVKLSLDTTKVPTLAADNTFTGTEVFNGFASFNNGFTSNANSSIFAASTALDVYTSEGGSIFAQLDVPSGANQYGWAIQGNAFNAYSGIYGYGDDHSQAGVIGSGNIGVYAITDLYGSGGRADEAGELTAAVYAQAGTISQEGASSSGSPAAVFADGGATQGSNSSVIALFGVTDENNAAFLINNSAQSTLVVQNAGSGYLLEADGTSGYCDITNSGDLQCNGTITGSNTIAEGRTLATYGVQSAENWYEDYGSGQLHEGSAQVTLDPVFDQTVNTAVDYHVFLTPKGDCKGLYVANETANGFEVHELGGGTTSVAFDYKIVARRKGYEQVRLEDITENVRRRNEERLKRQAANVHPASHPAIPPASQHAQLKPASQHQPIR